MKFSAAASAVALMSLSGAATASVTINNHCGEELYLWQANPVHTGNADFGPANNNKPYSINKGSGSLTLPFWEGSGTSVKISKTSADTNILQFELCPGCWGGSTFFDLSNLDGKGDGRVGTPFASDNVFVKVTGASEDGNCHNISCPPNQVCKAAYQQPNDSDTLTCPASASFTVDLCAPSSEHKKRERNDHGKHLRRHQTAAARAQSA